MKFIKIFNFHTGDMNTEQYIIRWVFGNIILFDKNLVLVNRVLIFLYEINSTFYIINYFLFFFL